jgi:hypothetical protein
LEPTAGKPSQLKAGAGGRRRLNGRSLGGKRELDPKVRYETLG